MLAIPEKRRPLLIDFAISRFNVDLLIAISINISALADQNCISVMKFTLNNNSNILVITSEEMNTDVFSLQCSSNNNINVNCNININHSFN